MIFLRKLLVCIFLSFKLYANAWNYPVELLGTQANEPPTAVVYGDEENQHVVIFWKNKKTNKIEFTFSNNLVGSDEVQFNNPIHHMTDEEGEKFQPVTYPTAIVANEKLYVFMIDNENKKQVKYAIANDLETITLPKYWDCNQYPISEHSLKGGVRAQTLNNGDILLTANTIEKKQFSQDKERLVVLNVNINDQGECKKNAKEVYPRQTKAGANAFIKEDDSSYDLHAIRISSNNDLLIHYESLDDIGLPTSFNGTVLKDENEDKIKVRSERLETLVVGASCQVFYVDKTDNAICCMHYDKGWTGFEKLTHSPSKKVFKSKKGVTAVEINGKIHVFYVDENKETIHHTFME